MLNKELGTKKLIEALKLMIEAWELLGMNTQAPEEYKRLQQQLKLLGGQ